MQVRGKEFPVEVYGVSPIPNTILAHQWSAMHAGSMNLLSKQMRQRRRKRSSVIIDAALEAKSGAKIKHLVGRKEHLDLVSFSLCPVLLDLI